jgi:hypothetical protein
MSQLEIGQFLLIGGRALRRDIRRERAANR